MFNTIPVQSHCLVMTCKHHSDFCYQTLTDYVMWIRKFLFSCYSIVVAVHGCHLDYYRMRKYYNEARKMKYFESLVEIPVLEPVSMYCTNKY